MAEPEGVAPPPQQWVPTFNPWLIAISVMLATVMEVLDTSVANVALTHISGNLSATTEEATWVLTSYLISNAIVKRIMQIIKKRLRPTNFVIQLVAGKTMALEMR